MFYPNGVFFKANRLFQDLLSVRRNDTGDVEAEGWVGASRFRLCWLFGFSFEEMGSFVVELQFF